MKYLHQRISISLLLILLLSMVANSQRRSEYNDGPYIEKKGDDLYIQWIEKGKKRKKTVTPVDTFSFDREGLPKVDIRNLDFKSDNFERYDSVSQYVAISDVHGQYDIFIDLLQKHSIIDADNKWIYGEGHLVIVGDMFDRGDMVTEIMWFLFFLEKEAKKAGGKVHVLLGNHELLVLHDDLRYIHPKYRYTMGVLKKSYTDLYSKKTVLGQWLRSKNITTVINNTAFVHGGYSQQVIEKESSLQVLNSTFKENVYDNKKIKQDSTDLISQLYFDNGPLWYRGYADPDGFDIQQANSILQTLGVTSIVVGHTSMPRIVSVHDGKFILIDSSIKFGNSGEMLIYKKDSLYRAKSNGELVSLSKKEKARSPFEYVYDLGDGDLQIVINTDVKKLIKTKMEEQYQTAKLVAIHNGEYNRIWNVRIRTRGNMRKKICELPPLKIDFPKSTLSYLGFSKNDKLKVVLPCDDNKQYQQGLYREYITYKLYSLVDTLATHARLVNIVLDQGDKTKYDLMGMVVEDEDNFAMRTGTAIIKEGLILADAIERNHYLKMVFFQYMIRNTDWSLYSKHNMEIIAFEKEMTLLGIPYDFDYAGIVGQDYAVPHDNIPIRDVGVPYFRGKNVTLEEVKQMASFYNGMKDNFYNTINHDPYLNKDSKKYMTTYLDEFYTRLNKEKKWKKTFRIED